MKSLQLKDYSWNKSFPKNYLQERGTETKIDLRADGNDQLWLYILENKKEKDFTLYQIRHTEKTFLYILDRIFLSTEEQLSFLAEKLRDEKKTKKWQEDDAYDRRCANA